MSLERDAASTLPLLPSIALRRLFYCTSYQVDHAEMKLQQQYLLTPPSQALTSHPGSIHNSENRTATRYNHVYKGKPLFATLTDDYQESHAPIQLLELRVY